jgi:hypothetical protein
MTCAMTDVRSQLRPALRNPTLRLFAIACVLAALAPFATPAPTPVEHAGFPGWPDSFEGYPLQPLAFAPVEERFARSFPGRIGRFSDGRREIVLRWIASPTRKLHAAADCFKGSGFDVKPLPLEVKDGMAWSAFSAQRGTQRLHVREAIADAGGNRWTDVSAWYWAAVRGETQGPWWAIVVATSNSEQAEVANVRLVAPE